MAAEYDSLILFTRLPVAGKAKTRLIPQLGAEGAAELQRRMTQHGLGRAWAWTIGDPSLRLRIAYDGGTEAEMQAWLGRLNFVPQGDGDLGERMHRCCQREFDAGARSVIIVGTDCPQLDETHLGAARLALQQTPVVIGPAEDGGYYLIGLSRPMPTLFIGMTWSTKHVLAESLQRARQQDVTPAILATLPDVDVSEDLPACELALAQGRTVSVIVPTLNEAQNLTRLFPLVQAAQPLEILVSDGGSTDATREIAVAHGARVIASDRGRARQMNAAAGEAQGEYLLFLHADTDPPPHFCQLIAEHLAGAGTAAGAFRFALREPFLGRALIEKLVALRCASRHSPYGDQGMFLRRSLLLAQGGFPDWPILEDVKLVHQLRELGRIALTKEPAQTSARRWQEHGVVRTFMHHQRILLGYALGMPVIKLAGWR
jgi:rSAM/selenodomain-associated transferase 2/rSAM/selenodomain-associated transferase 1